MSTPFYDLASLVVVPSGYKASKVYAQKPLTTDGQLTFSRASTATRVNSAGLIETVSSNVPRLDYLNSSCPRLILEGQRTNLALFSEQINNAYWGKLNATVDSNVTTSPDGYTNADRLKDDAVSGSHYAASSAITVTNATQYTFTAYLKADTLTWVRLELFSGGCFFNLSNGTLGTASGATATITSVGNGWYRCSVMATSASTTAYASIRLTTGNGVFGYAGNGSGVFIWGAQLEAGAYATSYIGPTLGAAVTRLADACSKTGMSSLIGQTEGTIYWEGVIDGFPVNNSFFGVEKTASNFVIRFGSTGSGIYAQSYSGSTNLFFETTTYTLGSYVKLAFAYKAGSYAFYKNGTLVASGTNASTIPACDSTMFNTLWGGTSGVGKYSSSQALLFKTRLTNAQLAELTSL